MNVKFFYALGMALMAVLTSACSKESADLAGADDDGKTIQVSTAKAEVADLPVWLESVGQIHSQFAATLAAEVEGRIMTVAADTGETIEQGQMLAEIDTTTLLLQRRAALAGLERLSVHIANGERKVARYETLSSRNLSSETQLDDARESMEAFRADYKAAEAELALVDNSIAKSRIVAPVSGIIQKRFIATGDFVKLGHALFEITDPKRLQAWLTFPETMAEYIRIGQTVTIYSPVAQGREIQQSITEIQPAIGHGSRALVTIIDIDDPGSLRPEATISGKLLLEVRERAIMVPEISVVRRPAGEVVYVINNDQAHARQVTSGQRQNGRVEIVSGLDGAETVAAEGAAFLTDGATVKITGPVN